ncbi:MAG: SRPBCC domain-containing protein [Bacteroidota bacterium]|nr:SRPBCC domain-containing protein [Bacteroidota bacterium]
METTQKTAITVEANINAPVEKVWKLWIEPLHIMRWNNASDDWQTPRVENDLRVNGDFIFRMEAKDGSSGFDLEGTYTDVKPLERIAYVLKDGRKVSVSFTGKGITTFVKETFETEEKNSTEFQKKGWQAILDNFKKYVESRKELETMHFEIKINASADKVYKAMLDEKKYQEWTAAFNPAGSYYKGSWRKGSKIEFLGPDKKGELGGMVSRIKENIPNNFVSIEHLGVIKNGKEIMSGPEAETFVGSLENYTFKEDHGNTLLLVDTDSNQELKKIFLDAWPKALSKVKEISEKA